MTDTVTEVHAIWAKKDSHKLPLERELDSLLSGYVYYPEEEWAMYEMRPPDTYPLAASWRDKSGDVFVFLLETAEALRMTGPDYLVFVAGQPNLVKKVTGSIHSHKEILEKVEKRQLAGQRADLSLEGEIEKKSIERFTKIVGIFTVIVNAFSLYLRSIPEPDLGGSKFSVAYKALVVSVHIGSLVLLLLIILLAIAYIFNYGMLMLRRGP